MSSYTPPPGYIRMSSLSTFDYCPKGFQLRNLYGKQTEEQPDTLLGKQFHKAMELYYLGKLNCELPSPIRDWVKWVIDFDERRGGANIFKLEDHIINDEFKLTGTIDRVDWLDVNESVVIIDYKTGSDEYYREVKAQLAGYALLFQLEYDIEVQELAIIYPKFETYKIFKFNKQVLKMTAQRVGKMRKAIRDNVFPRTCTPAKYNRCKLCDIKLTGLTGECI